MNALGIARTGRKHVEQELTQTRPLLATGALASEDYAGNLGNRLLDRFKAQGFTDGLWPERTVLGGIHHLTSLLLSGFGPAPARP